MFKKSFWVFLCFALAACAPASAQMTTTADLSQTEIAAPTATTIPTITPTITPSLTPTPLGGGNGTLLFSVNTWAYYDENSPKNETDGIYTALSSGLNLQQILNRSQIESIIGTKYGFASYRSLSSGRYITADGNLYAVTEDWTLIRKVEEIGQIIAISPDSTRLLYLGKDEKPYISNLDGSENKLLVDQRWSLGGATRYNAWSADSSTIYFEKDFGKSAWAVNSNGSNLRKLSLTALNEYPPIEEGYYQSIDSYAISPDNQKVAFTWAYLLFVADPTDLEFSTPELIIQLPGTESEIYLQGAVISVSSLMWSPDKKFLLAQTVLSTFDGHNFYDTALVNMQEKKIETIFSKTIFSSEQYYFPCGFSPDGQQIAFIYQDFDAKMETLKLVTLDGMTSTTLIEYDGRIGCPIWE